MAFRTRKRRRSPQYTDGEDPKRDATTASSPDVVGRDAEKESARIDKEREVWETFRDEYYEGESYESPLRIALSSSSYRAATLDIASTVFTVARAGRAG
jgi:hypothetical protein